MPTGIPRPLSTTVIELSLLINTLISSQYPASASSMALSTISILGVALATLVLFLGELLKNETKEEYVKKGYNWNKVLFFSNLFAILLGRFSAYFIMDSNKLEELNLYLIPFATTIILSAIFKIRS